MFTRAIRVQTPAVGAYRYTVYRRRAFIGLHCVPCARPTTVIKRSRRNRLAGYEPTNRWWIVPPSSEGGGSHIVRAPPPTMGGDLHSRADSRGPRSPGYASERGAFSPVHTGETCARYAQGLPPQEWRRLRVQRWTRYRVSLHGTCRAMRQGYHRGDKASRWRSLLPQGKSRVTQSPGCSPRRTARVPSWEPGGT